MSHKNLKNRHQATHNFKEKRHLGKNLERPKAKKGNQRRTWKISRPFC